VAIAGKYRRKLVADDRRFIWFVREDEDSSYMVLHVASEDKRFLIQYYLEQPDETRHLIVLGPEFVGGVPKNPWGGSWRRFLCPKWEDAGGRISPRGVRSLIDWCYLTNDLRVEVDWLGRPVGSASRTVGAETIS
jgi:hypothetical protein